MKANTIEEFFGTLQQSVVESWRKHLKTDKYSEHIALNEFYEEMPELVDALIEAWMGINSKVKSYKNIFTEEKMGTIEYLETLNEFVKSGKDDFLDGEDELESLCDDILAQIDSTLYKIKELKESKKKYMNLKEYLTESQQAMFKVHCDIEDPAQVEKDFEKLGFDPDPAKNGKNRILGASENDDDLVTAVVICDERTLKEVMKKLKYVTDYVEKKPKK